MVLRRRWGVVDEIVATVLQRAASLTRFHEVVVEIEKDLPAARVDSEAIAEVLYTLLDNATKYAPEGTQIRITANRAAHEMIEIAVEDQGPGVPLKLRESIFDKFFSTTQNLPQGKRAPGIGLGLAIARGLVMAHGGNIHVEDGSGGQGARMIFTVPVGDEELAIAAQAD